MTFLVVHHGYSSVGQKPVSVRRKWVSLLHISMGQVVGLGFKCCLQGGPFDGTSLTSLSGLVGMLI